MQTVETTTSSPNSTNAVLAAGFSEDDVIEGVFLLKASSEDVFFNRKNKLRELTGFDGDAYEEDDEGGIFKLITTGYFENMNEVKSAVEIMKKYNWFFYYDSDLLLNGKEIFSGGRWLV